MRQHDVRFVFPYRRALTGLLFSSALFMGDGPAVGQGQSSTDAERIARMRDLAGDASSGPLVKKVDAGDSQPEPAVRPAVADEVEAVVAEQPAATEPEDESEPLAGNEALPLGSGSDSGGLGFFAGGNSDSSSTGAGGDNWLLSTLAALGVVIGLVFAIRWLMRRGGVVTTASPKGSLVEVLSRTTVAPRSHVVLMRVGQRVLIVSDSPAGMRTLAQVADPEEVAELLGSIDASAPASMSDSFQGVMRKLSGQWADNETPSLDADGSLVDDDAVNTTRGAVSSLRGRLALLSKTGAGA